MVIAGHTNAPANQPMTPQDAYRDLIERYREARLLESISNLIGWDERTYMPRQGLGPPRRADGPAGPAGP